MNAPNGHGSSDHVPSSPPPTTMFDFGSPTLSTQLIKQLVGDLEAPFDGSQIEWRVTNTSHDRSRGQVVPYADQCAYTDRLNALVTPAGWTRKYTIHTSANFERSKDQKIVAKVLVTCELTIFHLGSHAAIGEEWADNDNAGTSAEAQAFKRACSCFGLGRYLYHFEGTWVDLDERKRPKSVPQLTGWATPEGWAHGLRPNGSGGPNASGNGADTHDGRSKTASLTKEIESMAEPLGRGLYRGLLRDLARVWNPSEIQDVSLQQRVLEHMRSAERGLKRLEAALDKVGPEALVCVLKANQLTTIERVDNLETLKRIVLDLERTAESRF